MKRPLTLMAMVELGAGLGLLCVPSISSVLLVGAPLASPEALTVARVCGSGLLALSVACWLARSDTQSQAGRGVVTAMLVYNISAVTVLTYAGLGFKMNGIALWPAVIIHAVLAIGCIISLRLKSNR